MALLAWLATKIRLPTVHNTHIHTSAHTEDIFLRRRVMMLMMPTLCLLRASVRG